MTPRPLSFFAIAVAAIIFAVPALAMPNSGSGYNGCVSRCGSRFPGSANNRIFWSCANICARKYLGGNADVRRKGNPPPATRGGLHR